MPSRNRWPVDTTRPQSSKQAAELASRSKAHMRRVSPAPCRRGVAHTDVLSVPRALALRARNLIKELAVKHTEFARWRALQWMAPLAGRVRTSSDAIGCGAIANSCINLPSSRLRFGGDSGVQHWLDAPAAALQEVGAAIQGKGMHACPAHPIGHVGKIL